MSIALVQSISAEVALGPISIAFPNPVTAGNLLLAIVHSRGGIGIPTDTLGNLWDTAAQAQLPEADNGALLWSVSATSGHCVVTSDTGVGVNPVGMILAEYTSPGATSWILGNISVNALFFPGVDTIESGPADATQPENLIVTLGVDGIH